MFYKNNPKNISIFGRIKKHQCTTCICIPHLSTRRLFDSIIKLIKLVWLGNRSIAVLLQWLQLKLQTNPTVHCDSFILIIPSITVLKETLTSPPYLKRIYIYILFGSKQYVLKPYNVTLNCFELSQNNYYVTLTCPLPFPIIWRTDFASCLIWVVLNITVLRCSLLLPWHKMTQKNAPPPTHTHELV